MSKRNTRSASPPLEQLLAEALNEVINRTGSEMNAFLGGGRSGGI